MEMDQVITTRTGAVSVRREKSDVLQLGAYFLDLENGNEGFRVLEEIPAAEVDQVLKPFLSCSTLKGIFFHGFALVIRNGGVRILPKAADSGKFLIDLSASRTRLLMKALSA